MKKYEISNVLFLTVIGALSIPLFGIVYGLLFQVCIGFIGIALNEIFYGDSTNG